MKKTLLIICAVLMVIEGALIGNKEEFDKQVTETDTSFRRCIGKECMAYCGILGQGCLMMESKG